MSINNKEIQPSDRLVSCAEAAAILNVKTQTLAKWRANKTYSLPYVKISNRKISYWLSDLVKFCQAHTIQGKSEDNN